MDKVVELNREYWGRVHDMCAGTKVKPWECVRWRDLPDDKSFNDHPNFNEYLESALQDIEFAVTVLEDKPAWVGDVVYRKDTREETIFKGIDGNCLMKLEFEEIVGLWSAYQVHEYLTWTQPHKRTFTLNGVELPCPVSPNKDFTQTGFHIDNVPFCFDSFEEAVAVKQEFVKILTEARDK